MDIEDLADIAPWEWPEDAHDSILAVLRDHRAPVHRRQLAAELAGQTVVIDDALAQELLAMVRSGEEFDEVRAAAALALGPALEQTHIVGFDDPDDILITEEMFGRVRGELRQAFEGTGLPKEVRRRVLEAAVCAPEDWQQSAVRDAWASDDREWKVTAVFAMGYVDGFDREILDALEADAPEIQLQALRAAGAQGLQDAWPFVEAILEGGEAGEDWDREALLVAIDAVPGIRPEEAASVLADLAESEDEEIADAAQEAIAMSRGVEETDPDAEDDELEDEDEGERP